MIDQLVLGLERLEFACTILPVACVRGRRRRARLDGAAHVLHGEMRDDFVHGEEEATAQLLSVRVDPLAGELLLVRRRAQVAQEGARRIRRRRRAG